ncbi:MAG: DinB family protein [Ferruginibacter sp.]
MPKPTEGTYPEYFGNYIKLVPEDNISDALINQQPLIDNFFNSISEEKAGYAYAEGKWTLKELLQHVIDTERIFNYRLLAIARGEKQSLPGFEENEYAAASEANKRSWSNMVEEFKAVRKASSYLFSSLTEDALQKSGSANERPVTAEALCFIIIGHVYHHVKIIKERYLND